MEAWSDTAVGALADRVSACGGVRAPAANGPRTGPRRLKEDPAFLGAIVHHQVHHGTAQDVPGIGEGEPHPRHHLAFLAVGHGDELLHGRPHVLDGVERRGTRWPSRAWRTSRSWSLSWMPALSSSMMAQRSRVAGVAKMGPEKPSFTSRGNRPLWSMCMAEHHGVHGHRVEWKCLFLASLSSFALEHAAIEQYAQTRSPPAGACCR